MKNTAKRITVIVIFAAMISAVLLYRAGAYDISFIKRPVPRDTGSNDPGTAAVTDTGPAPDTEPADSTSDGTTEPPEPPPDIIIITDDEAVEFLNSITTVGRDALNISLEMFDVDSLFVRTEPGAIPQSFARRNAKVSRNEIYTMPNQRLGIRTVTKTEAQPALKLYFGYLFADLGKSYDVYSPGGKQIAAKFTGTLPYLTTKDGQPLVLDGGSYFVISEDGISEEPVPEENINRMALTFDFPVYYPGTTDTLVPFSDWLVTFTEIEPPEPEEASSDSENGATEPAVTDKTEPAVTDKTDTAGETVTDEIPATSPDTAQDTDDGTSSAETAPDESSAADNGTDEGDDGQTGVATAADVDYGAEGDDETSQDTLSPESDTEPEETEPFPTDVSDGDIVTVNGKTYAVEKKIAWGFKDQSGNIVVEAKYKTVYQFTSDGLASVVGFDDEIIVINSSGREIFNRVAEPAKYSSYMANLVKTHRRHLGAVNDNLSSIGMYYYDRGYCLVRYAESHQTKIELINISEYRLANKSGGYYTVPGNYRTVNYSDGIITVEKDGLYGYFSIEGKWVSAAAYSEADPFLQGLAVVKKDGKYGMINRSGEFVLPIYFDYISGVSRGFVTTWSEDRGWELYCITKPDQNS